MSLVQCTRRRGVRRVRPPGLVRAAGAFARRLSGGPGDLQDQPEHAYHDRGLHAYEHSFEIFYLASEPRQFVDEVILKHHDDYLYKLNHACMANCPTNRKLYSRIKSRVRKKYKVYPSAYANGSLVRQYKSAGGRYRSCSRKK